MNPVRIEIQHFKFIVGAGKKKSLATEAGRRNNRSSRFFYRHQILRMGLVFEHFLEIRGFGSQGVGDWSGGARNSSNSPTADSTNPGQLKTKSRVHFPKTAAAARRGLAPQQLYAQILTVPLRWTKVPQSREPNLGWNHDRNFDRNFARNFRPQRRENMRPHPQDWTCSPADRSVGPGDRIRGAHWKRGVGIQSGTDLNRRTKP